MITSLDKFGRVIIPKKLREHLGLNTETTLNISAENKRIVIELVKDKEPIVNKEGILVYAGKLDTKRRDFIKSDRNKRLRKLWENEE